MNTLSSFPVPIPTAYLVWNILRNLGFDPDSLKIGVCRDLQLFLQLRTQGRTLRFPFGDLECSSSRQGFALCKAFSERLQVAPIEELRELLTQPFDALLYVTIEHLRSSGFTIPVLFSIQHQSWDLHLAN